jgi:thiol-disulfide isomerase/thioredoxin
MTASQRALAVALVVGAGVAAGFLSYRLNQPRSPLRPMVPAPSPGAAAPDVAAGKSAPPPPVPTMVPDVQLPDLAGQRRSLRSFEGRPLIINFWATWCAPCRREMPLLRELRQRYKGDRLEIVGIAVDFSAAVHEYLRHTAIDYPVLIGEQEGLSAAQQFGVEPVLPFSVFADAGGHIVAVKVGELHREEADFILTQIRSVDRGQVTLVQAQEQIDARLKELAVQRAKARQGSG